MIILLLLSMTGSLFLIFGYFYIYMMHISITLKRNENKRGLMFYLKIIAFSFFYLFLFFVMAPYYAIKDSIFIKKYYVDLEQKIVDHKLTNVEQFNNEIRKYKFFTTKKRIREIENTYNFVCH